MSSWGAMVLEKRHLETLLKCALGLEGIIEGSICEDPECENCAGNREVLAEIRETSAIMIQGLGIKVVECDLHSDEVH